MCAFANVKTEFLTQTHMKTLTDVSMEEINNRPAAPTFHKRLGIKGSDIVAHTSKWELMLTETMTITEGGQNRMLVR